MSSLSNLARDVRARVIASKATSYEAFDGGTLIENIESHNVRDYFRKYGSTARRFDHVEDADIYIGYVQMLGKREFLSAIVMVDSYAVIVSFDSEVGTGNDLFSLMAKKEFAETVTAAVKRSAEKMRRANLRPAPPIPPLPTQPAPVAQAGLSGRGMIAYLAAIAVMGALAFWWGVSYLN